MVSLTKRVPPTRRDDYVPPLGFSDVQLNEIMAAARALPVEQRDVFLRCVVQQLRPRSIDVLDAINRARRNLSTAPLE